MNKEEYQKLVKEKLPKEPKLKNACTAFLVGGCLGFLCEVVAQILMTSFAMDRTQASGWVCLLLIFIASLLTALHHFDTWVSKWQAGLILPTTGFAHSVTSSALDYRNDGLITGFGANFFKLAGSVLLYGIVSAFFLSILGVFFYG